MTARSVIFVALASHLLLGEPMTVSAGSFDQLTDFTGRVSPIVTLKGRDTFTSEYRYDVSVRNLSPDSTIGDSLVIVLDKITNLAGQDREGLTGELSLDRFDVLDAEGQTDDGKPYFHIPVGTAPDLAPQTDSLPVSIHLRNKDYMAVFTPSFRVLGTNAHHRIRNTRNHRHPLLWPRHRRSPTLLPWTSSSNC